MGEQVVLKIAAFAQTYGLQSRVTSQRVLKPARWNRALMSFAVGQPHLREKATLQGREEGEG